MTHPAIKVIFLILCLIEIFPPFSTETSRAASVNQKHVTETSLTHVFHDGKIVIGAVFPLTINTLAAAAAKTPGGVYPGEKKNQQTSVDLQTDLLSAP